MTAAYTYLLTTGTISIDTTDLLTDVEGEWTSAFGATLNTDASTPQGTMIASETTARTSVMKNNAELANMQNPNLAYGVFLDAICALLGITRGTNLSTVAQGVQITGNSTVTWAAGSRVQTPNGDIFTLVNQIEIPVGGTLTNAVFQSQAYGAIPFPLGAMEILDGQIGIGGVSAISTTTVALGATQLTDPQLKNARNQQLAIQGTASAQAVYANLLKVPNVTSCQVVENNTGQTANPINGITFTLGSALWVCVAGTATPSAIAAAAYAAHNSGCPWDFGAAGMGNPVNSPNGTPTQDPITGCTYEVKSTTPIMFDVYVNATITQSPAQSPGEPALAAGMISYASGQEEGEAGLVVGANVNAFEMGGSLIRQFPGIYVKNCMVACVPAGNAAPTYPGDYVYEFVMSRFQQGNLQLGNINLTVQ
jgi:hypothetical protein